MSRLDQLVQRTPLRGWRLTAWCVIGAICAVVAWAYFSKLERVASAEGAVVPQGQVKVIQHLEGGIIKDIRVTEGDAVKAGDVLLQLDTGIVGSTQAESQIDLDGLLLTRARLEAEATGNELSFPEVEAARRPDLVLAERQAFDGNRRSTESTLAVLEDQLQQQQHNVSQLQAEQRAAQNNHALAQERFRMAEELIKDGLMPRLEYVQLKQEVEKYAGEAGSLRAQLPKARAAVEEAQNRIEEEKNTVKRRALEELASIELRIARAREALARTTDLVVRTEIKSPIDGVVKSLRYHTKGAVALPGEPLMEIVPSEAKLVVEAKLSPIDVGQVKVGQPTVVKISTYDFAQYGALEGQVTYISADSQTDSKDGLTYFRVVAETDRTHLGDKPGELPITPGMQATLDIHTGERSVLDFLLRPIRKAGSEAFRER
ncbi:MAG: HlyD family type I secretion periplasmic adaptor subunit [Alphaproteobacteria bacterium]